MSLEKTLIRVHALDNSSHFRTEGDSVALASLEAAADRPNATYALFRLSVGSVLPNSKVEATISYQYPAQPGEPLAEPQVQKFSLKADPAGFKGFALGYGEDVYKTTVTVTVTVDGKVQTFGQGPVFDPAATIDFKALVPMPPAPPPGPAPIVEPIVEPVVEPLPVVPTPVP